jgi:hypothetical protein
LNFHFEKEVFMSAFAPIVLEDGADTPVEHTFSPSGFDLNGVARLYEATEEGSLDSRYAISLGVSLPKNGSQVARVTAKVVIPVMDSENPLVKIGELIGTTSFVLPKTATLTSRADILALMANFLADASVVSAVQDLESIY